MDKLDKVAMVVALGIGAAVGGWVYKKTNEDLDKATANAKAEIIYAYVPPRGSREFLKGKIKLTGASTVWHYNIRTFVHSGGDEGRWWPKPYWNYQYSNTLGNDDFDVKICSDLGDEWSTDEVYSAVVRRDYPLVADGQSLSEDELPNTKDKRVLATTRAYRILYTNRGAIRSNKEYEAMKNGGLYEK
jgi:hypothetical protein